MNMVANKNLFTAVLPNKGTVNQGKINMDNNMAFENLKYFMSPHLFNPFKVYFPIKR